MRRVTCVVPTESLGIAPAYKGFTHSTHSNAAHQLGENAVVGGDPILGGSEE